MNSIVLFIIYIQYRIVLNVQYIVYFILSEVHNVRQHYRNPCLHNLQSVLVYSSQQVQQQKSLSAFMWVRSACIWFWERRSNWDSNNSIVFFFLFFVCVTVAGKGEEWLPSALKVGRRTALDTYPELVQKKGHPTMGIRGQVLRTHCCGMGKVSWTGHFGGGIGLSPQEIVRIRRWLWWG